MAFCSAFFFPLNGVRTPFPYIFDFIVSDSYPRECSLWFLDFCSMHHEKKSLIFSTWQHVLFLVLMRLSHKFFFFSMRTLLPTFFPPLNLAFLLGMEILSNGCHRKGPNQLADPLAPYQNILCMVISVMTSCLLS